MNEDVEAGATAPELLPFGVFGPLTYRSVTIASGSGGTVSVSASARAGRSTVLSGAGMSSLLDGSDATIFGAGGVGSTSGTQAAVQPRLRQLSLGL